MSICRTRIVYMMWLLFYSPEHFMKHNL